MRRFARLDDTDGVMTAVVATTAMIAQPSRTTENRIVVNVFRTEPH